MKIIEPSFEIVPVNGEEILKNIERAGRTCYKSEDKITADSARKFVAAIIKSGQSVTVSPATLRKVPGIVTTVTTNLATN